MPTDGALGNPSKQGDSVLVIGAGIFQIPLIHRLHAKGYRCLVAGASPEAPTSDLRGRYVPADICDAAALQSVAREYRVRVAVSTASELGARAAAWVNSSLGLGRVLSSYVDLGLNKERLRSKLRELELPTIESSVVRTIEDLSDFERLTGASGQQFVMKPCCGWGSHGVFITSTSVQRQQVFGLKDEVGLNSSGFIIESYLEGPEFGGNAYFVNGALRLLAVTKKALSGGVRVRGHFYDPRRRYGFESKLEDVLTRLAGDAGFRTGIVNFDVRSNELLEPVVLDVGFRDGGNGLSLLIRPVAGTDSIDVLMANALDTDDPELFGWGAEDSLGFSIVCFSLEESRKLASYLDRQGLLVCTKKLSYDVAGKGLSPVACFVTHGHREDLESVYREALSIIGEPDEG